MTTATPSQEARSTDAQIADAVTAAEAAVEAKQPAEVIRLLEPLFQQGLSMPPRAFWLVGRALTIGGNHTQGLELYRQAFALEPNLPFIECRMDGLDLRFSDAPGSTACVQFAEELYDDPYKLRDLNLRPGEVFVDVGANVGFVSVFVAKKYPDARIIAFEPAPETFKALERNLALNGIGNVTAINKAVNADGRDLELFVLAGNSGASGAFYNDAVRSRMTNNGQGFTARTPATTLEQIFETHGIDRCQVLKLDCEGAEFEILEQTTMLERIDRIIMEMHVDLGTHGDQAPAYGEAFIRGIAERVPSPPSIFVASMVGVVAE